jgi:glucose-6-phosphate isomerase
MAPADTTLRLPGELAQIVEAALERATAERWARRIWDRDVSLWTGDSDTAGTIEHRLGWLDAPSGFVDEVAELTAFAEAVAAEGRTDAIVCGMGGSSLAPEVLSQVLPRSTSGLRIHVLDSTDPAAVQAAGSVADPAATLKVIATKSGTTTETLAFLGWFWQHEQDRVGRIPASDAGNAFVAITDPGRSVESIPHADVFRETFLNPEDVGGRYNALTYVGLVPAALQGLDLGALLEDARLMGDRCHDPEDDNPGVALGVAIGALAGAGRNKLTFVIEPDLAPLGAWLEQLIAESTGKVGTGIVPVDGEPLGEPACYRSDRTFVRIGRDSQAGWRAETDTALNAIEAAGHPVIDITLSDGAWVGGEFFRWEFATAVAGIVLGVNPFDEPNVTESKENTARVLEHLERERALPDEPTLRIDQPRAALVESLRGYLATIAPTGYHAVCAFIAPTPERTSTLRAIQAQLRDGSGHATTLGYGPRFLHSTGQLHKGGPPEGVFLQLVAGHPDDVAIPGRRETFGTLVDAQALGDFASLRTHGLPVVRIHLSDDPDAGLALLATVLGEALRTPDS